MNTLRPVRLKLAWQSWPKGHVFTAMPAAQAQHMVSAGQAEYDDEQVKGSPVDRMMRPAGGQARSGKNQRRPGALL